MPSFDDSFRLQICVRCRVQVHLCTSCDRGHIYCRDCAPLAARDRVRRAGRRYQDTSRGRANHAQRQRRYRQRQAERRSGVTHRGGSQGHLAAASPSQAATATTPMTPGSPHAGGGLRVRSIALPLLPATSLPLGSGLRCSMCSACCPPCARRESLRELRRRRVRPRTPTPT